VLVFGGDLLVSEVNGSYIDEITRAGGVTPTHPYTG